MREQCQAIVDEELGDENRWLFPAATLTRIEVQRVLTRTIGETESTSILIEAAGLSIGAVLAAARRGKVVHPNGVVCHAHFEVQGPGGAPLLSRRAEQRAVVRFSWSLALPRQIPDLLGLSLRILDAHGDGCHQDFLLAAR